ncbi:hypothetical protein BGZ51_005784 [Haplosporangium sp. Z 767]|nr:hypothetical protein BGZ51_005784 [Haplosporangium sp. Z 767]KAF9187624.1 hypothetical protein BGZ50_001815 [Haplosporangium sp. Z 11]
MDSPLRAYLRNAARKFDYILSDAAQREITSELYASLWDNNDEFLHNYFPHFVEARQNGVTVLTDNGDDEYSPSARGQACGHTFKTGEGVFRCRTCAFDETCVFCLRCFHGTNHEGHDTSFSVNAGGGGCCDCGDAEAWKVDLDCIYHSAKNIPAGENDPKNLEYPPEVAEAIRKTIATILDFIIDTMTTSPENMNATRESKEQIQRDAVDAGNIAGETTDLDNMDFACILWNDEDHSFPDVINRVSETTSMSSNYARKIAETVDTQGRAIVEVSNDIPRLMEIANSLAEIRLVVSIRSARETFKEQLCDVCISFLKSLAYIKGGAVSQKQSQTIREIICEELCSEWRRKPNKNNTMSHQDTVAEMEDDFIDIVGINPEDEIRPAMSHVLDGDMDLSGSHHDEQTRDTVIRPLPSLGQGDSEMAHVGQDEDTLMAETSSSSVDHHSSDPFARSARAGLPHRKLRIDWLLLLDLKFWKMPRASLRELYIGTLVLSPKYKKFMAVRFAFNYLKIARAFLVVDREPEVSIILFSVQLFTVPTIAEMLAREHNFIYILCQILISFFQGPNYTGGPINCNLPPFENRRYFHIFHDFRYILANDAVKQIVANRPAYQSQMIECLNMFQGMHPNTRYSIDHIEFETNTWVNAFNVTLQLYKCCRQFSDCFSSDASVLTQVLARTIKKIYEWCDKHEEEMAQTFEDGPQPLPSQLQLPHQTQNAQDPAIVDNGAIPAGQNVVHTAGAVVTGTDAEAGAVSRAPVPARRTQVHTVTMPTTPPLSFEVIEYKVSAQPVAFHHPLHWFLADLLENVDFLDSAELQKIGFESFRQMMIQFVGSEQDSDEQRIFKLQEIFDYPLRVCVLMAQIKANVWVRNGFVIRTQAQYYREVSLRENTYDSDIFLLQVAMVLFEPEHFLVTALDRFELLEWFSGQREHSTYDLLQIVFMAEELLTLLIVCVSDRVNAAGFTIEQEIRREIVHGLCLKPIAYSELTKRIPERLTEHVKFDDTLKELATYRAPDGITDHGLYELKDQFFDEVDPYFIHFSRNNSEEAEEILKSRMVKKSGNTIKSPQILPRLSKIERGPFQNLGNMMHTKVMTQILFYTFWNVKAEPKIKSDTIIDQAAYLMQIAILDTNNDAAKSLAEDRAGESSGYGMTGFMRHATFEKFPVVVNGNERIRLPLLSILIQRADDPAYKSIQPKLNFVLKKFEEIGSTEAKAIVGQWKASKGLTESDESGTSEMEEAERRKKANQERQARVMAQFAQAQQSFMSLNGDLYDSDEDDSKSMNEEDDQNPLELGAQKIAETTWHYPTGTCIVCQEEMTQSSEYGMLAYVQPSHVLRQTPMDEAQFMLEAVVSPLSLDVSATSIRPFGIASNFEKHHANFEAKVEATSDASHGQAQPGQSSSRPSSGKASRPQRVARGFPTTSHRRGLYTSSCGHLMHIKCFETYVRSLHQRHEAQHNRNHPEDPSQHEYMCPLCKSLGNLILPIIWKGKKQTYPGVLVSASGGSTQEWLATGSTATLGQLSGEKRAALAQAESDRALRHAESVDSHGNKRRGSRSHGVLNLVQGLMRGPSGPSGLMPLMSDGSWLPGQLGILRSPYASMNMKYEARESNELDATRIMYLRLAEVFQMNSKDLLRPEELLAYNQSASPVAEVEVMWDVFAYTISCVEITQRGVNAANGTSTLIAGIQQQTLTLLRMMADTIVSYVSMMVNRPEHRLHLTQLNSDRLSQILHGRLELDPSDAAALKHMKPLLLDDPFFILTQLALNQLPGNVEPGYLLEILLAAEIVKTIAAFVTTDIESLFRAEPRIANYTEHTLEPLSPEDASALNSLVTFVITSLGLPESQKNQFLDKMPDRLLLKLLKTYVLPFLRKSALLMDARYGVLFPETQPAMSTAEPLDDEYSRLAALLHLPELLPLCTKWAGDDLLKDLVRAWCEDAVTLKVSDSILASQTHSMSNVIRMGSSTVFTSISGQGSPSSSSSSSYNTPAVTGQSNQLSIGLNHPAIYELVGLPRRLDALFEQSIKYICPKCNTVPHDPALCLCCGIIVCSQSFCCLEGLDSDGRGECNTHALTCTGPVGIYLLIKKCVILLLHVRNGCFHPAPFLDEHGEADLGLRRGRPQFLNPLRYDDLRRLWLTHGIPIHVARKIEQSYDIGGWRTL